MKKEYNIKDKVWIHIGERKLVEGRVVEIIDLVHLKERHSPDRELYIIELKTGIDDIYEVRDYDQISPDAKGPINLFRRTKDALIENQRYLKRVGIQLPIDGPNPLAELLSLDFTRANELEVVDGALTGRVIGKVVDRQAKRSALIEWAAACDVDLSQTIAVGDGSNDLDMMHAAGLSVAFNAKQIVKDQANMVLAGQDLRELATALGLSR